MCVSSTHTMSLHDMENGIASGGKLSHNITFSFVIVCPLFRGTQVIAISSFGNLREMSLDKPREWQIFTVSVTACEKCLKDRARFISDSSCFKGFFCGFLGLGGIFVSLVWVFFSDSVSSSPALFYMTFLINSPLLCWETLAAEDRMTTANPYLMFTFKLFESWHRFEAFVLFRFSNSKWWAALENVVSFRDPGVVSLSSPLLLH